MDNNNLFNTTPPGADILNHNSQPAVNDLLTQGYNQPSPQQDPLNTAGGQYSSNFGQDAFALRESMNSNIPQPTQPQQNPYTRQTTYTQQTSYTQQASAPNPYNQPQYSQQGFTGPGYSQVPPTPAYNFTPEGEVSVGEWFVTIILTFLPCIGVIMLLVWAFGSETSATKRNWARATLIIMLILTVLGVLATATVGTAMARYMFRYF